MTLEDEVRVLNVSVDLIASYVNYATCCLPEDRTTTATSILPSSSSAKRYFYILLLEMISSVHDGAISAKNPGDTLLSLIVRISEDPKLDPESMHISALGRAAKQFQNWLDYEFEEPVYSANIDREFRLRMRRGEALYLIGNRCKHTLIRSNTLIKRLLGAYGNSGVEISPDDGVLVLEDIDYWLYEDFGGYHFTKLCELSASVYHEIVNYVEPVQKRALVRKDHNRYSYALPSEVDGIAAQFEFYELLNRASRPFLPKIATSHHLEGRY